MCETRNETEAQESCRRWGALTSTLAGLFLTCCGPQEETVLLKRDAEVTRQIRAEESHEFELRMEPNQLVRIVVEQRGVDVGVGLYDPDGKLVAEVDSPTGRYGPERLSAVSAQRGTYCLAVRALGEPTNTGTYRLVVEDLRSATGDDLRHVEAERFLSEGDALLMQRGKESLRGAVERYGQSLDIWRELAAREREADILLRLGWAHRSLEDEEAAETVLQEARKLYEEVGDRYGEGLALNSLGGLRIWRRKDQEALGWIERALAIGRELDNVFLEAESLTNLGIVYGRLGQTDASIAAYSEARDDYEKLGELFHVARTRSNLAFLLIRKGELRKAADDLKAAFEIRTKLKKLEEAAIDLSLLGDVRKRQGRLDDARSNLEQALELRRQVGNRRGEAVTLNSLGTTHLLGKDFDQARSCYEQAREIFKELGETGEMAVALVNLGRLYVETGQPQRALELHREAEPLVSDRPAKVSNFYGMARALHDLGQFEASYEQLAKTLAAVEEQRTESHTEELRMAFFATKQHYYKLQIDVLKHLDEARPEARHGEEAFVVSERSRARSLLEALGEDAAKVREQPDPNLLEQEATLQAELNELEQRLIAQERQSPSVPAKTEVIKEQQREKAFALAMVRGRLRAELTQPRLVSAEETQRMLKPGTTVLAYSLGEERSFLWKVTSDEFEWYELVGRSEIESAVREAHRLLISRNPDDDSERRLYLAKLSDMLLGPVASGLDDQRLVIAAEGALLYLPFAALPRPSRPGEIRESPRTDGSPDYLVRSHEIVYLPSVSVLRRVREQRLSRDTAPGQLAVFADPVFTFGATSGNESQTSTRDVDGDLRRAVELSSTSQLEPLPHTREEAEDILRIARGRTMAAFGYEATKDKVLDGEIDNYQILHFATHGLTNREQPELSGLALSQFNVHGQPLDGFLRLHEIYNLHLSAELVVLSACQTGIGREVRGEGFLGLTRGFIYAGAPRLVVSLWSVADLGTAELMKRFYWNLLEAQAPPALALRAAQLAMLEAPRWQHPYYWAGFVFQGEWWSPGEEPPIGTALGGAEQEDESDRDYPGPDEEWCDSLSEEWMRELCRLLHKLGEPENE